MPNYNPKCGWKKGQSGNPAGRPIDKEKIACYDLYKSRRLKSLQLLFDRMDDGDAAAISVLGRKVVRDIPSPLKILSQHDSTIDLSDLKDVGMYILRLIDSGALTMEEGNNWFDILRGYRETALAEEIAKAAEFIVEKHKEIKGLPVVEGLKDE